MLEIGLTKLQLDDMVGGEEITLDGTDGAGADDKTAKETRKSLLTQLRTKFVESESWPVYEVQDDCVSIHCFTTVPVSTRSSRVSHVESQHYWTLAYQSLSLPCILFCHMTSVLGWLSWSKHWQCPHMSVYSVTELTPYISATIRMRAPEMTNLIVINTLFARVQFDQRISYHIF